MKKLLKTLIQMYELIQSSPELFKDGIGQDLSDMINYCIEIVEKEI